MANPEQIKRTINGILKWMRWAEKEIDELRGNEDPARPPIPPDLNGEEEDGGKRGD